METSQTRSTGKRALAFAAALVSAGVAAWCLFFATFPFWFAESGPSGFKVISKPVFALAMLVTIALFGIAWQCYRYALSATLRRYIAIVLPIVIVAGVIWNMVKRPDGATKIGGEWYAEKTPYDSEHGLMQYRLYLKGPLRYRNVDNDLSRYHYFAPDCLVYAGSRALNDPMFAVCGDRTPVEIMDEGRDWQIDATGIANDSLLKPIDSILAVAHAQRTYDETFRQNLGRTNFVSPVASVPRL